MPLSGHLRMNCGKQHHAHGKNKEGMGQPDQHSKPPADHVQVFENEHVENGEDPSVQKVCNEAIKSRELAVGRDYGPKQVRTGA